ncbi:WD repeat-containing protein 12 [Kappamyces sp. JEL0680]|nr:WD repeat-containing protein 12 [Kappamyces sp. JEL0680]
MLDVPVPFDFILQGKFLRGSLQQYLDANQLSTENVLQVQFVELSLPPNQATSLQHDDWISSVAIHSRNQLFATGSFDGQVRIWDDRGSVVDAVSMGSTPALAVKKVEWISDDLLVAGDSQSSIVAYKFANKRLEKEYRCEGHEGSIISIGVSADGKRFASGSWDKSIKIWTSDSDSNVEMETIVEKSGKKQKMHEQAVKSESLTLNGHTAAVSSVLFDPSSPAVLYSGSWDHSIRSWDMEQDANTLTINCEKVVLSMKYSAFHGMLLSGHEDGWIRAWDPRSKGSETCLTVDGLIMKQKLGAHKNWVSGIALAPHQENHIATSSYDGSIKVWDLRSSLALYTLHPSGDENAKIFDVAWQGNVLASGGEDAKLHLFMP